MLSKLIATTPLIKLNLAVELFKYSAPSNSIPSINRLNENEYVLVPGYFLNKGSPEKNDLI